ncbi:MAG: hypothetical protein L0H53_16430 [Candidatus Nitrosocosmicus sp.]|nr:hypothetical protein [Candidatus Nitrosocosmicus sp.]MDN5868606.1 hypothetical protein [Candidatus Nitrosocosmicus sp.]
MVLPIPLFDYSLWILFSLFVGIALALDLGLLTKITSIIRFGSKRSEILHRGKREQEKENKNKDIDSNNINLEELRLADQASQDTISKDRPQTKDNNQDESQKSNTFKHALH